jgi:hypothetical protein
MKVRVIKLDNSTRLIDLPHKPGSEKTSGVWRNGGETAIGTDDLDADVYQAPPSFDPQMLYGIAGDIAKHAALNTEVNRVAAAANAIALVACNAGRATYQYIGDTAHYAAIYTMHVGRTSIGGKGDALSLVDRVVMRIEDRIHRSELHKGKQIPPDLLCNNHSGGLSSGEGLITLIHDGISTLEDGEIVETQAPIPDKRLLITETEFSNVLHQARRTGNTLTSRLRDSFDGKPLMPLTKQNRMGCREPHICIRAGVGAGNALETGNSGNYPTTHLPKYWLEIGRAIEQAGRASKALREG